MTAGELRNPVTIVIAVEANDRSIHVIGESSEARWEVGPRAGIRSSNTQRAVRRLRAGREATVISSSSPNA
jgi:hypothetical protein